VYEINLNSSGNVLQLHSSVNGSIVWELMLIGTFVPTDPYINILPLLLLTFAKFFNGVIIYIALSLKEG
jgi:hypothetical protein